MRVTGFDGQQQAARKALGPTARAVHPSPPHPVKFKPPPLSTLGGSPNVHAPTPGHTYKPIKQGPMPVLGFSNKQLDRIGMSRRARARQSAQQQGRPMVGPPNTQTAVSKLEQIRRGLNKQSDQYAAMFDPVSHENLAFDANFAKNLIPQSLVDIAHGRAPSGKHLGTDALFFLPWSRGLRASAEAINAARIADEAGRGVKAAEAAKASFKEGRGVIGGLTGASKKLLPSERALRASSARKELFAHLDSTLEPRMAKAQKALFDKSVKAMVRNGNASDTADAVGKLIHVRSHIAQHELPADIKGLYQHEAIHVPQMPDQLDARAIAKEIRATHGHMLPNSLKRSGALERAINRTYEHVKLGAGYRDWYQRYAGVLAKTAESSKLGHVSPRQLAQLMSVYSPRAMPTENFRRALESALQHGDFGYFAGQADKAKKILQDPTWFEKHYLPAQAGPKISNYYANALKHLDPAHYAELGLHEGPAPVTIDTHMNQMLAGQDRIPNGQYDALAQVFRHMGQHLGWDPAEVQAASWVSKKAANEAVRYARGGPVKPASEFLHNAGDAYERAFAKYGPQGEALFQKAEHSLPNDTFNPHVAQVTSEANPDPVLWPRLRAAYDKLAPEQQVAYSRAMDAAQAGVFEHALGLNHLGNREGLGIWRGVGSHGAASHLLIGPGEITPQVRQDMEALTAAQGMAKHQNSVSWGRPVPPAAGEFHGIHWTPPQGTDPVAASAALDKLAGDGNVGFIHAPDGGFYVVNFSGQQGADFAIRRLGGEQTDIGWQGGYTIDHRIKGEGDWAQSYQDAIAKLPPEKRSALELAMTDVRKKVEQIDAQFLGGHVAQIVNAQEAKALEGTHVFHGTNPITAEQIMAERTLRTGDAAPEAAWTTQNPDQAAFYSPSDHIVAIPRDKVPMGEGDKAHPFGNYGSPSDILFQHEGALSSLHGDPQLAHMSTDALHARADELAAKYDRLVNDLAAGEGKPYKVDTAMRNLSAKKLARKGLPNPTAKQELRNIAEGKLTRYMDAHPEDPRVQSLLTDHREAVAIRQEIYRRNDALFQQHDPATEQEIRNLLAERAKLHEGLPAKGTGDRVAQIDNRLDELIGPGSGRMRQETAGAIRGAFQPITTPDGMKAIIHLTEHANVTTLPHELGHFLRRFGLNPQHEAAIAEWAGVKNGVWDRQAEEKFAQGLEAFIRSGAAPNSLKAEFEVLAPAFRAEYPAQGALPALTPEAAQVYKQILGHKDGLHNAAAFLLRNRIAAHQLAIAGRRGPNRTDEGAQMYLDQLAKEASAAGFGTKGGGPVAHLARGEITPETGGALGALVRAGLEDPSGFKAAGTYERVGATLDNAPKSIAQMEAQQEAARGVARSVKAGNLHAAQQDALNTENPFQSFLAAGAARKGMLPKAEFHGFATLEPHLNDLTMFVGNHPGLRPFEKSNVMEAIARGITDQKMPTAYERKLLRKAFGREAATGWAKAVRKGEITLADVLNVPRAAMASADLSAGLRQGLAAAFYKPGMFTQDWIKQLGFAFSEGRYQEAQKMIEDHPWFSLADRAKVSYTEIGSDLNAREEAFGSQLAEQIPGVGKIIRGSDRAYTGFLNVLRMHLFNYMVHDAATKGWNMDDHALESIGSVVNAMTGRGNLPQALAEHRAFLNAMFFSPGLAFSRLNMLGFGGGHGWQNLIPGSWYMALHPYARQEALRSFTRLAAGISTVLFFAHAAGASVSIDPRNSDFGKIRIGDTRFDVAGGFQQWVRLVTELGTGQIVSSTTGRTESLSGGGGLARTRLDAALQFLENKAAPVPAMTLDLLRGTGFGNQPLSVQGELAGHLVPLVWQDMYQIGFTGPPWNAHLNKEPGAGIGMAAAAAIPDLLGVGVQNYGAPGPKTGLDRSNLDTQSQKFLGHKPPPQVEADVQWKAQLDANTYAGQSSFDKAKAVTQLFDQRYHTNLSASLLPKLHTQGQAEAVYRELRSKLFPALEQWQTAVDRAKRAAGEKAPVPQNTPPPGATSAPASVVTDAQDASYHIPASQVDHGVLAAHHTIIHPGTGQDHSGAIAQAAQAHGLDPQAVLAVASQEGLSGGVGDHGTSFGPFQLHAGGALPAEVWAKGAAYAQQWAWSPQGINYALSRMSAARGLHGQAAVSAIVSQFERPANPGAEIQGAMGAYGHAGAAGAIQMPGGFGGGPGPGLGAGPSRLTSAADQALEMLASGTYSPMRMLSVLSSQPLQNTMAMPGGIGHIRFQIPKFTGPVGKAARGAIALAQAFLGTPYVWGGESPKGFDCSGLLQYIYAKQGIHIPRTSEQQFNAGTPVGKSQLRPGDAVFFRGAAGEASPGHVGIYIGHGKFIEAPHTGATVRISNLAGYPGYVGARRYARARGRRAA